ncbi:MAG: hypothetical protein P4L75_07320 [Clostridia bacterium]|nr:hypothetical protein [Clostridia bacterium]
MKQRKFMAVICVALIAAMVAPIAASAKGLGNIGSGLYGRGAISAAEKTQIASERAQIKQLHTDIVSLKKQERDIVASIKKDLAGTKGNSDITSSQDYKDVVAALQSVCGSVGKAEGINYRAGLKTALGLTAPEIPDALVNVISQLTQKKTDLQNALTALNAALTKADSIAAAKAADISQWSSFRSQAVAKKQTIDQQHAQIVQAFADCRDILSQIVATASANKAVLDTKVDDVKGIETELQAVIKSLRFYDGTVRAAAAAYQADRKSRNYTDALAQLDKIITIQQTRLTTLAQAKTQLQNALGQLNTLVSTGSSVPSTSSSSAVSA